MSSSNTSPALLGQLNLNLLPDLEALLLERSVSAAARRMGVTQSAMSHTLAKLRILLSDPLLVVSGREMVPTPRARELSLSLPCALATLQQALAPPVEFDPRQARCCFRIATYDYFEITTLPEILEYFRDNAPGVELDIQRVDSNSGARLSRGEIDFVIGGQSLVMPSTLMQTTLYHDPFCVIARPEHPDIQTRLSLSRYLRLDHVLVSVEGRGTGLVDRILAQSNSSRRVALRLPHFGSAALAVLHSDMICTIASTIGARAKEIYGLRVFPVPVKLPSPGIVAWWPPQHQNDPARRWFRDALFSGKALSTSIQRLIKSER